MSDEIIIKKIKMMNKTLIAAFLAAMAASVDLAAHSLTSETDAQFDICYDKATTVRSDCIERTHCSDADCAYECQDEWLAALTHCDDLL